MEESAVQAGMSIETLNLLIILSLAMNVVLMFAFAYLVVTRRQDERFNKVESSIKKLSGDLRSLERKMQEVKPQRVVNDLPQVEAFGGFRAEKPPEPEVENNIGADYALMDKFIEEYNLLAASMSVPKQLQACEKFVKDHNLRMIRYGGMMNFMPAVDVEESNYWAWKIPNKANLYAVVPNPMKPCDRELYERGGMNTIFEMNYNDGVYAKYIVETPATFTANEADVWQLQDIGEINLQRK